MDKQENVVAPIIYQGEGYEVDSIRASSNISGAESILASIPKSELENPKIEQIKHPEYMEEVQWYIEEYEQENLALEIRIDALKNQLQLDPKSFERKQSNSSSRSGSKARSKSILIPALDGIS